MNLALSITLSRIILAPLFTVLFLLGCEPWEPEWVLWLAVLVFIVIEVTDWLDGEVARRYNQVTDLGKLFDPISDVICHFVLFLTFVAAGIMPLWLFLVYLYREMLVTMMRMFCLQKQRVVAARMAGKIKTGAQAAGVALVLLLQIIEHRGFEPVPERILGLSPTLWLLLIPAVLSLFSAVDLFWANRDILKVSKASG